MVILSVWGEYRLSVFLSIHAHISKMAHGIIMKFLVILENNFCIVSHILDFIKFSRWPPSVAKIGKKLSFYGK